MKNDLAYYIREQLREDRVVSLPDLGSFKLVQTSAQLLEDKHTISPPSLTLVYDEEVADMHNLIERISIVEGISIEKAKKKLKKYSEKVFNKLINLNKIEIPGIGTLTQGEGDKVQFFDTVDYLTDEFRGLHDLKLKPIARFAKMEEGSNEIQKDNLNVNTNTQQYTATSQVVEKKSRPWWIPLMGGLLLALLYILPQQTCDKGTTPILGDADESSIDEEVIATEKEVDAALALDDDESNEANIEGKATDTDIERATTEINTDLKAPATVKPEKVSVKEEETKVKTPAATKPQATEVNSNNEAILSKVAAESSVIKSATYDGQKCVIIVGSFTKPKYALRMMNKVERLGYEVYSSQYNNYTRVGIEFECNPDELETYLTEARSKLDTKAWYLISPQD